MGQQDAKGVAAGPADALHALASRAAHTHQLLTSKGVKFFSTAARPGAAAGPLAARRPLAGAAPWMRRGMASAVPATMKVA